MANPRDPAPPTRGGSDSRSDGAGSGSDSAPGATEPARFGRRFGALLIDWLLCVLVSTMIADPRTEGWPAVLVLIAEYALFLGLFAQTPGMAVARLQCVSYRDGGAIGIPRALLRAVLLCLVVPAVVMDDQRRGLHDRAAGSIVIAAPRA